MAHYWLSCLYFPNIARESPKLLIQHFYPIINRAIVVEPLNDISMSDYRSPFEVYKKANHRQLIINSSWTLLISFANRFSSLSEKKIWTIIDCWYWIMCFLCKLILGLRKCHDRRKHKKSIYLAFHSQKLLQSNYLDFILVHHKSSQPDYSWKTLN
jgi:hypothetical protein